LGSGEEHGAMGVLFFWEKATRFAQTSFSRQKSTPIPPCSPGFGGIAGNRQLG
jgi:hypothetical protein